MKERSTQNSKKKWIKSLILITLLLFSLYIILKAILNLNPNPRLYIANQASKNPVNIKIFIDNKLIVDRIFAINYGMPSSYKLPLLIGFYEIRCENLSTKSTKIERIFICPSCSIFIDFYDRFEIEVDYLAPGRAYY